MQEQECYQKGHYQAAIEAIKAGDSVSERDEQQLTPYRLWEYTLGPNGEVPKLRESIGEVNSKQESICTKIDNLKTSIENSVVLKLEDHESRIAEIEKAWREQRLTDEVRDSAVESERGKLKAAEEKGRDNEEARQAKQDREFFKRVKFWSLVATAAGVFLAGLTFLLRFIL